MTQYDCRAATINRRLVLAFNNKHDTIQHIAARIFSSLLPLILIQIVALQVTPQQANQMAHGLTYAIQQELIRQHRDGGIFSSTSGLR